MIKKILGLITLGFMLFVGTVFANPLEISLSNTTATSTVSYMTPGTGTTTYYYDTYSSGASGGYAADGATMLVQMTASTSASSQLKWGYEFAMGVAGVDCVATPNNCDWYKDNTPAPTSATSTNTYNVLAPVEFTWTFASTSQGYVGVEKNNNRALKVINVPTPTRYTRVVFSVPASAGNAGVWAAFVEQRQSPQ